MKHILYILPYLEQGGTEKQALSLMTHFKDRYYVSLLAPGGTGIHRVQSENIAHHQFERLERNLYKGLSEFFRGIQRINRLRPIDMIHVHAAHELMLLVKLFLPGIPIVFTVHGYHGSQSKISYFLSCQFSNWFADAVIAVCQAEEQILSEFGLARSKLHLIYNGVDEPELKYRRSQELAQKFNLNPQEQVILGTAARLTEAKGLPYLIHAFAKLAQNNLNLRLVLAGSGEMEQELKQLVQNLHVQDKVIFAGYVDDLPQLMELFHIFVLPSLQEACSLACVEAMAQKKAVVGTRVGGISEQVIDLETGFIVASKDVDSLAEKLDFLINNKELVSQFGHNGYRRYKENFTTDTMLNKTEKIYKKLSK